MFLIQQIWTKSSFIKDRTRAISFFFCSFHLCLTHALLSAIQIHRVAKHDTASHSHLFVPKLFFPAKQFDCSHLKRSRASEVNPLSIFVFFFYYLSTPRRGQTRPARKKKSGNKRVFFNGAVSAKFEIKDIRLKSTLEGGGQRGSTL